MEELRISPPGLLDALRQADQFRVWESLEDARYCLVCGKRFTGYDVQLKNGADADAPVQVHCPTPDCPSIPMDWAKR